ncbi:MAG TPA: universal stress protein [Burkholderiales bacterium]|nr:universal stress protein [Burkholderiales bacterium]
MFKHILVPIDDSPAALQAVKLAARFAKDQKARVTAFWAAPAWEPDLYAYAYAVPAAYITPAQHSANVRKAARRHLKAAEKAAAAVGVRCKGVYIEGNIPYQEIVRAARRNRCDLIVMASHASGLSRLLLGSQTAKVLAHATVPVMVIKTR